MRNQTKQQGFVAIFTVLFFILLISVITVSFLRITAQEQRQAIDNDLTASALASAEAGVEEAKRAILRYAKLPAGDTNLRPEYAQALRSPECDALFGRFPRVSTDLKIQTSGQVSNRPELQQSYTCLTVAMDTTDYINKLDPSNSDYIPLRPSQSFDSVTVSWHMTASDGDKQPGGYALGSAALRAHSDDNPPDPAINDTWSEAGYPAYLRVQVFGYPNGSFNLDNTLEDLSRTVYLVPTNAAGGRDENNPIDMVTSDSRDDATNRLKSPPYAVRCKGNPPATPVTEEYACSVRLNLTGVLQPTDPALPNHKKLFLRVTPIYGATNFKLTLGAVAGTPRLVEVQPIIDSTGKVSDVFRRVQTRVRLDAPLLPEYSLETAQDICKNMIVTTNPADFVDNICN